MNIHDTIVGDDGVGDSLPGLRCVIRTRCVAGYDAIPVVTTVFIPTLMNFVDLLPRWCCYIDGVGDLTLIRSQAIPF